MKEKKVRIALIGDSTVTVDLGWGQAFANRFNDKVQVFNFAAGGRSSRSWYNENRLPEVLKIKPDYVFIQFGHNDQPGKGSERETDPTTSYSGYLKMYVNKFREIGAIPVIVSSVVRRRFDRNDKINTTLTPWADAAKTVAIETKAPFIDLHLVSINYHNRIGSKISMTFNPAKEDYSHFNQKGEKVITDLIIQELKQTVKDFPEIKPMIFLLN